MTEVSQTAENSQTSETQMEDKLSFLFSGGRKRFYSADMRLLICILLWDAIGNPRRDEEAGTWEFETQMMVLACVNFKHPSARPYTILTQAICHTEDSQGGLPRPGVFAELRQQLGKQGTRLHTSAATPFSYFGLY